jgi:hypothetical protein
MAIGTYSELQTAAAKGSRRLKTGPLPRPEAERFWEKVEIGAAWECWPWRASQNPSGYGAFRLGSMVDGSRRQMNASQWVCEQAIGRRFVRGEMACHHCDNPPCCNPSHLYVGNAKSNGRDAWARGRVTPVHLTGETNGNSKLSANEVREILRSNDRNVALAIRYGVSKTHIGWIKSGKSWGHLSGHQHLQ